MKLYEVINCFNIQVLKSQIIILLKRCVVWKHLKHFRELLSEIL